MERRALFAALVMLSGNAFASGDAFGEYATTIENLH